MTVSMCSFFRAAYISKCTNSKLCCILKTQQWTLKTQISFMMCMSCSSPATRGVTGTGNPSQLSHRWPSWTVHMTQHSVTVTPQISLHWEKTVTRGSQDTKTEKVIKSNMLCDYFLKNLCLSWELQRSDIKSVIQQKVVIFSGLSSRSRCWMLFYS